MNLNVFFRLLLFFLVGVNMSCSGQISPKYKSLPLGDIKPKGWLNNQLNNQANGLCGHLDEFYPQVMNSAWKGNGEFSWEDAPYYLNGMVPTAYLLNNEELIHKSQEFINWILNSQQANGWFGPEKRNNTWPQTLVLKTLISYYEASGDSRVIPFMKRYFEYLQNNEINWGNTSWPGMRAMEMGVPALWLYGQTGDNAILDVVKTIKEKSFNWQQHFLNFPYDSLAMVEGRIPPTHFGEGMHAHGVNLMMALKYPAIMYSIAKDEDEKRSVYTILADLDRYHGQLAGRISADDNLNGTAPDKGTELCSIVDEMFSMEKLFETFGDVRFADRLEDLAYNALPGSMAADCWSHQYNQQTNQVLLSQAARKWTSTDENSNILSLMGTYPSCLVNMHQGWPMFIKHLWMQTEDDGLVALSYAPCEINAKLKNGNNVSIVIETDYPFDNRVKIKIKALDQAMPLYFRIPKWADDTEIEIPGKTFVSKAGKLVKIECPASGYTVSLTFPTSVETETRYNNSVSVRRGPLYYALYVEGEYKKVTVNSRWSCSIDYMGAVDWDVSPKTSWNFALNKDQFANDKIKVTKNQLTKYPFAAAGEMIYDQESGTYQKWENQAPVVLEMKAKQVPEWGIVDNSADLPPLSPLKISGDEKTVRLIPYGCARLRIAEFPYYE